MRSISLVLLLAAVASAQSFVVRNVTVIDGTGAEPKKAHVLVGGGKIVSVVPANLPAPKSATTVDGTGKYLIPGLWDMHVHLWESDPMFRLYTVNGVVGLRDMGSDYARTRAWAKEALATGGPRVYTPGAPVEGPGTESTKMPIVRVITAEDGRRAADALDSQGVDFIKVMSSVPYDSYIALAQRARLRRAIFAGHLPESVSVVQALEARQRSMEHMFGMVLACSTEESGLRQKRYDAILRKEWNTVAEVRERTYATVDLDKCVKLFRRMSQFDFWQVPTLTLIRRLALMDVENMASDKLVRLVPESIRTTWQDPAADLKKATPEQLERFREGYNVQAKLVGLMAKNGVGILAGTDTGDPFVLPGFALHDELAALVDAGLSPLQALQTATINAARYLGIDQSTGSIQRGKSADLVLLDANPLSDIRNTRKIQAVVVRGELFDRKRLDRLLAGK